MPNPKPMNSENNLHTEIRQRLRGMLADTGDFFFLDDPEQERYRTYQSALDNLKGEFIVDPVALCEFSGHYTFYGNRTLLKTVRRTDTVMPPNPSDHIQKSNDFYSKQHLRVSAIAEKFTHLLIEETKNRLKGCQHVGILLSGGMDSRVTAAVLRELQNAGWDFKVTCFTWGKIETRDPIYAKRIADKYNWTFEHFEIDHEVLWENVNEAARLGCFCSAQHLHAMPAVAKKAGELGVDIMVAASYGDSIGRGEYSRIHVSQLPDIRGRIRNWYGLINKAAFVESKSKSRSEIERAWQAFGITSAAARPEVDQQIHYMRNMLGSAMSVIDEVVPLAQAFTSWPVVGFMWSLAPSCRTDAVYYQVLKELDPSLLDIPWARTGKLYQSQGSIQPDNIQSSFHEYGRWTRMNLSRLEETIYQGALVRGEIFDVNALNAIFYALKHFKSVQSGRLIEISLWLASLSIFLESRDITLPCSAKKTFSFSVMPKLELAGTIVRQYKANKGVNK